MVRLPAGRNIGAPGVSNPLDKPDRWSVFHGLDADCSKTRSEEPSRKLVCLAFRGGVRKRLNFLTVFEPA
jgi:hypothetical protein